MRKINTLILLFLFALISPFGFGQSEVIRSGPMLGYVEMTEAAVWIQTANTAEVSIQWSLKAFPDSVIGQQSILTKQHQGNTAQFTLTGLKEGTSYIYSLHIDGKKISLEYPLEFSTQKLWQYRTDPPEFSMLTGSCAYINEPKVDRPGKPYGGDYQIFEHMGEVDADIMLWLGDNMYLREVDWNSMSGVLHRYTHTRSIPEMQKFLASTHHYAIWDDHDYGPNDSDRSYWMKDSTLEAFKYFWANPSYGLPGIKGVTTFFEYADVDFFMLDNRFNRTPNYRKEGEKTILGEDQIQWLIDALSYSKAPFKIVAMGGQFLNTAQNYETYSNHGFDKERQRIIDLIAKNNIKGVIFLTGDRHYSEISKMKEEGIPLIYEITSSTMSAGANTDAFEEENQYRIKESVIQQRNFCKMEFKGPRKDRRIEISFYDSDGILLYSHIIKRSEWNTK